MEKKICRWNIVFIIVCLITSVLVVCNTWIYKLPSTIMAIVVTIDCAVSCYYSGYTNAYEAYKRYLKVEEEE